MIPILTEPINRYLANLLPERDAILTEMENYAQDTQFPIVGPQVGRLLIQYSRLMHAKHIFEMGSGFGYSAYWFCLGASRAQIILTDTSRHSLNMAEKWFKRSGINSQCQFSVGDARETLIHAGGVYDIIFIDIDKDAYPHLFHNAIDYLRKGGLLITDNV